jgi:DNA repair protein RadD
VGFVLRPYQASALQALDAYWIAGGGNPLVSMATGTGKSLVIAWLIRDVLRQFPSLRILVLTHVQELIEQNLKHLIALWPDAPLGMNCAALGRRDCGQRILFASIQSVFRNPQAIGTRDLVLIDEAHLVPPSDNSMYRSLLASLRSVVPDMRATGFSATCYRLDSGRLDEGDDKIFDEIVFDYGIGEGIRDGWLAPLSSKGTTTRIDVSGVGRRGGEFIDTELQDAADIEAVVHAACDEIVALGSARKSWLVFCTGIVHALHVRDALRARGVVAEAVFGETAQDERERIIKAFRAGQITALINVMVLTTGFDVPHVDLIAMLRTTLSTGLYVQMIGRGTRKAPGKGDCLVLDFAGNVHRHGPVDCVDVNNVKTKSDTRVEPGTVRARECPQCHELNAINATVCVCCGFEWPRPAPKPKHATVADAVPILSGQTTWLPVDAISFHLHRKYNDPLAPPSLRVEYLCGLSPYAEYISIERQGYARTRAEKWWFAMGGLQPVPGTVLEALDRRDEIDEPVEIAIIHNGKFWNVSERRVRRPDDSIVEIDSRYHCWTLNSRATAVAAPPPPIDDVIPW